MKLVVSSEKHRVRLWLPLFIIWLLLLPLVILLLPLILIAQILLFLIRKPWPLLGILYAAYCLAAALRGLRIDVENKHRNSKILITID
ncbi:MAG: hypothetical protein ACYC4Q_11735 [Victivallaceae bacterium]